MYKFITVTTLWAKNVNNLLKLGWVKGVNSSTNYLHQLTLVITKRAQVGLTNIYFQPSSTNLYTYLNSIFNLLNKSFTHYPQPLLMSPAKEI